jgi:hypothetical protein
LVDPFKYKKGENPILINLHDLKGKNTAISKTHESQLLALDEALMKIDKKLLILKYVTPTNIDIERQKFIEKAGDYIPKFEYKEIPFDIEMLQHELKLIEIPDIPLAELYDKKQQEIYNKLQFLKAFKSQNASDMTLYSKKIFGNINEENFAIAKDVIADRGLAQSEKDFLSYEDIKDYMKKFNHIYGIKVKILQADTTARFTMKGDTLIFRRGSTV